MEALKRYFGIKKQQRQAAESTAWQRYRKLLQDFTDGVEVDVDEADRIMEAVGRDESQLEDDIKAYQKRLQHRRAVDTAKAAEAEQAELGEKLRKLNKKITDLQEKLAPEIEELSRQYEDAGNRAMGGAHAAKFLMTTVMDESIGEREESLNARLKELHEIGCGVESHLKDVGVAYFTDQLKNYQLLNNNGSHDEHIERTEQRLQLAKERAKPLQDKLATIDAEMQQIRGELADLRQQKMEP